ncbi:MAG: hypothetical protein KHZ29_04175, partial [Desulfovibrionaceae bacterium]|nr:hypothetical protein [Desulfovibrionaceae bacterium]
RLKSVVFRLIRRGRPLPRPPERLPFSTANRSKPPSGLTERHENPSLTARQSRDRLLIFRAADFIGSLTAEKPPRYFSLARRRAACQKKKQPTTPPSRATVRNRGEP